MPEYQKTFIFLSIVLLLSCTTVNPIPNPDTSPLKPPEVFFKGSYMAYAKHQETYGNVVFKENGVPKDAFQSLADQGANMVRLRIDNPPYSSSYTTGYAEADFGSPENVKVEMQRAINAGLQTLLTFGYQSMALDDDQILNPYVAPLAWQPVVDNLEQLKDSIYKHTYTVLEDYIQADLVPEIVSIGNETNQRFLEPNKIENELEPYSVVRTLKLLNAETKAVRDLNEDMDWI